MFTLKELYSPLQRFPQPPALRVGDPAENLDRLGPSLDVELGVASCPAAPEPLRLDRGRIDRFPAPEARSAGGLRYLVGLRPVGSSLLAFGSPSGRIEAFEFGRKSQIGA